jgi:drug/metabolite transporter (DMT)-like permease
MARGIFLLAVLALVWGTSWPAMKVALGELPVLTFRALCLLVTGPMMLLLARLGGERIRIPRRELPPLLIAAFFNFTTWFLLSGYALSLMQAGRASIIAYTMPIWALLPSWFILGERPTRSRLIGLALGVTALAFLIAPDIATIGRTPTGPFLMLLGAAGWAVGTVLVKRFRPPISVLQLTGWQASLGGIPIVLAALLLDDPFSALAHVSWQGALLTAYVAIVPSSIGQLLWFKIIDLLPVTVATIGSLAVPVVGVIASAVWLGETVHLTDILALGLVVAAFALILRRK